MTGELLEIIYAAEEQFDWIRGYYGRKIWVSGQINYKKCPNVMFRFYPVIYDLLKLPKNKKYKIYDFRGLGCDFQKWRETSFIISFVPSREWRRKYDRHTINRP
jgi:hypothetical protein